jgi:hypothetical protein
VFTIIPIRTPARSCFLPPPFTWCSYCCTALPYCLPARVPYPLHSRGVLIAALHCPTALPARVPYPLHSRGVLIAALHCPTASGRLRLLETEEAQNARINQEVKDYRAELEALRQKYANLLQTAKTHEEMAAQAAREAQLRAEELRLLRAEVTQLRNQNVEMKRKMQVINYTASLIHVQAQAHEHHTRY